MKLLKNKYCTYKILNSKVQVIELSIIYFSLSLLCVFFYYFKTYLCFLPRPVVCRVDYFDYFSNKSLKKHVISLHKNEGHIVGAQFQRGALLL